MHLHMISYSGAVLFDPQWILITITQILTIISAIFQTNLKPVLFSPLVLFLGYNLDPGGGWQRFSHLSEMKEIHVLAFTL